MRLEQLGLSDTAIARRLGVTDKTVAKGIRWLRNIPNTRGQMSGNCAGFSANPIPCRGIRTWQLD
jgi:hypothetical protein